MAVPPQAYFVERLVGEAVEVQILLPPQADHHAIVEPNIQQMQAMARAAMFIKVGHDHFLLEKNFLDKSRDNWAGVRLVDSGAGMAQRGSDTHLWVSPAGARHMVRNIAPALMELLPERAPLIAANLASLLADIDGADARIRAVLRQRRGRSFYVYHAAWGYFATEYGLTQVSIEQGTQEPDAASVAATIARAKAEGVQVILAQPQYNPASAALIAREIGGRVEYADPLARNWLEQMHHMADVLGQALTP